MRKLEAQQKKLFLYFSVYFMTKLMYVYINAYLPIYFTYASAINITKLGLVLFVSYSFMFAKPLLSIYFDRSSNKGIKSKGINKKVLLIIGTFAAIISFIILLVSLELLIIFMIFLGLNLAFVSLIDVIIDKFILENSINESIKNKSAFYLQFGGIIGAIIPNVYYFFLMEDRTQITSWYLFFITGMITLIVFIPSVFLLKQNGSNHENFEKIPLKQVSINLRSIILMSFFIFFSYGTYLYEWVLEPWAVKKLGSDAIFALFMIIFIIFQVFSLLIAQKYTIRFDKKQILIITSLLAGILICISPFMEIYIFFILMTIVQLISGFFLIAFISLMIDISRNKVLIFQIMAAFAILANLIFAPLGLNISVVISGEWIIMIAGLLQIIAVIPLFFI